MRDEEVYKQEPEYRTIKDWREEERPRERLLKNGAASLTDSELLAILIRAGTKGVSALDVARELLNKFDDLNNLSTRDYSELKTVKGLGGAKTVTLLAAFELGKRIKSGAFKDKKSINRPEDLANIYIPVFEGAKTEIFKVIMLNSANKIIREINVSEGTLNTSVVHPREVFRFAITESAASVILLHNHPSGNPQPSNEDLQITKQLVEAGKIIGIRVVDHLIIAGDTYTSLKREGLM